MLQRLNGGPSCFEHYHLPERLTQHLRKTRRGCDIMSNMPSARRSKAASSIYQVELQQVLLFTTYLLLETEWAILTADVYHLNF